MRFFPDRFSWVDDVKNKYAVLNADLKSTAFPVRAAELRRPGLHDFALSASAFTYDKGGHVLKILENHPGEQVMRKGCNRIWPTMRPATASCGKRAYRCSR